MESKHVDEDTLKDDENDGDDETNVDSARSTCSFIDSSAL